MRRVGLVPAAGRGTRWNYAIFPKEMLPCDGGDTFLTRCVRIMLRAGVDQVLLVTNESKANLHAVVLGEYPVVTVLQKYPEQDLYGAMREALSLDADEYVFAMPDTYFPPVLEKGWGADFTMLTFRTNQPERYGVLSSGWVVNKSAALRGEYEAWGVLYWTRDVLERWLKEGVSDYTTAINLALKHFKWRAIPIEYYYDMGSFGDYKEFLEHGYQGLQG